LWIERGWVSPYRGNDEPLFHEADVARVRFIRELSVDLAIEEEALPAVLSLVDQVYGLRSELRALTQALCQEPEEVRTRVLAHVRRMRSGR
jgi:chaperone modulatory protein CbpM